MKNMFWLMPVTSHFTTTLNLYVSHRPPNKSLAAGLCKYQFCTIYNPLKLKAQIAAHLVTPAHAAEQVSTALAAEMHNRCVLSTVYLTLH